MDKDRLKLLKEKEPVPIQSITGTEEFESFVYIEAQDVFDWYYLRSGEKSNRTDARYYYVAKFF